MTVMNEAVVRLPVVYQLVAEYGDELLLALVLRANANDVRRNVVAPRIGFSVDPKLDYGQAALEDFAVKAVKPVVADGFGRHKGTGGGP